VLVADDQSDVVTALRLLLRREGYEADAAASVDEVRRSLAARPYDLLLMDLNYARDTTSGREELDLLADVLARDRSLPVIVMTGWGSIDTAVEAMRRGARTFVHKPWDNAVLAETVRREIDDGRVRRAAAASAAREREDAQRIQRALLPRGCPALPWGHIAARWTPASTFGGDCYDVLSLSGGATGITIADVAGKGLPAALVMAQLQASVRAFAGDGFGPAALAARTNAALCRNATIERFVTFFYAAIDATGSAITWCNAGHNAPVLLRADGSIERLDGGGMVLGVMPDAPFIERRARLRAGDRLVLFTDGITEATAANGEAGTDLFGDAALVDSIRRHRECDAMTLVDAIVDDVARFAGGPCTDDATVLALVR
jgi:sigma-B regulation protein RsbU (phosphoserine phosphatase)